MECLMAVSSTNFVDERLGVERALQPHAVTAVSDEYDIQSYRKSVDFVAVRSTVRGNKE